MCFDSTVVKIKNIIEALYQSKTDVYNSGVKCDLFLLKDVNISLYNSLVDAITQNNEAEFLFDNKINNNSFTFFSLNNCIVCVGFFGCDGSIRVVVDGKTAEPQYKKQVGANKTQPALWQFEVDHRLIDCGMCYIMQSRDGSFFVIDSAHTYSVNDCERIHDFLKQRTADGEKIRIRGWFLSHGHEDHIAQFMNYIRFYMEDTIIDKVYCNFISNDHRDGSDWMQSNKNYVTMFYDLMEKHPEIPVCRLHTGMYFYSDLFRFDVLCSHEDVFPDDNTNYNDSSVVIMMEYDGCKVLFPGDAGGEESRILEERYGSSLKADIVQQAHHGHFGTSAEFYELVNAEIALFPVTQIKFDEELPHYRANQRSVEIAEYYFIASNGTVEIPLPYSSGNFKLYPDETFESFSGVYNLWAYKYDKEYKENLYKAYLSRGGKPLEEYSNGF